MKDLILSLFINANLALFVLIFMSYFIDEAKQNGFFSSPVNDSSILDFQLLQNNYTQFHQFKPQISEFEFYRLKEITEFIRMLQYEEKISFENLPLLTVKETSIENAGIWKRYNNYSIEFTSGLLQNQNYSINELKAITAHELGHFLKGHLDLYPMFIRSLHRSSAFSPITFLSVTAQILELLSAAYIQKFEFEADEEAIRLYPYPHTFISTYKKLDKAECAPQTSRTPGSLIYHLDLYCIYLFKMMDIIRLVVPEENRLSHPSFARRIAFFKENTRTEEAPDALERVSSPQFS